MNLNFWLGNHTPAGQRSLEDVIAIVGHQLMALGHRAMWDPKNDDLITAGGVNVIVEGFNDNIVDFVAEWHGKGARFICLATEEPVEGVGFNHQATGEMAKRQADFVKVAPYLDAIWHLVPGQNVTDWYAQYAPSAYVELGYAKTLVRSETQREPAYDFGFYGTMSRRRERLLKKLANATNRQKAVRVMADFGSQVDRDRAMQEAKVIIQIRKFDEMGLVSSSRCNTALCLGRPVVAEPHEIELMKPWADVVKFARTDEEFISLALATRGAWRGVHAGQFERFRAKFTPEVCVGPALKLLENAARLAA